MKRFTIGRVIVGGLAFVAVMGGACEQQPGSLDTGSGTTGDGAGDGTGAGTGTLRVLITDKPFPYELIAEANITITRVEVRRDGGAGECDGTELCDDGDLCTVDSCDPQTGECVHEDLVCEEGTICNGVTCVPPCVEDAECDDDAACTTDACVEGLCVNTPADCDDADPCTVDSCDAETGECVNEPLVCEDGTVCNGGVCVQTCVEDAECDDADDCTQDACVEDLCVNTPVDCDDGNDNGDDDGNDNGEDDGDEEDDVGTWLVVFEGEREFNLLDLQGGRTDLLADADVPAGTYSQMRLIVTSGEVVLDDEAATSFPLSVPSGSQTGIKLHFEFTVADGEETSLLLDVDVSKAFLPVPGGHIDDVSSIREFKFKPSVAMKLIRLVDAGSISGTVTDDADNPVQDASVTVYQGDDVVGGTATGLDGTYTVGALTTGTYTVEFSATGFEDATVEDVAVTAGQTTENVDVQLTATP